ncbi:MAG: PAS domain S-box protein [Terriglobia bacterium]
MTRTLRDMPINRKLRVIIVMTSGYALLLSGVAIVITDSVLYQTSIRRDLAALAQIVADNTTAALAFKNAQDAQEILATLRARPRLVQACIYTLDSRVFAEYVRQGSPRGCPQTAEADSERIAGSSLFRSHPIILDGKRIGSLYFHYELGEIASRRKLYAALVGGIALVSMLVAFILSSRLRRLISEPITQLAGSARAVSETKDYSIRAEKQTQDEMGLLVDSFNEMLANIQQRDGELESAQVDLTERVELRTEQLRESEERTRLIVEKANDAFVGMDSAGRIVEWNSQAEVIFGWPRAEVFGRSLAETLIPERFRDAHWKDLQRILASGEGPAVNQTLELPALHRDGHEVLVELSISAIRLQGTYFFNAFLRDISERKKAEEALRARTAELQEVNQELEAFTYSVAHDLRAPLRHIDAFSHILEEEARPHLTPQATQYLDRILQASRQMGHLVDDLLNLSRVGRRELSLQLTGLNSVVEEVLDSLRPETERRQIEWKVGKLPFVEADPSLLKQVFANLLSNAVKYTRPRDRAVIEVGSMASNGSPCVFVRDNGVGFNMKYAEKLFGIFQRLHRQEDFEGTGIGLATVQRIIHKHGGHVWAEAELDKGATFYFTLGAGEKRT